MSNQLAAAGVAPPALLRGQPASPPIHQLRYPCGRGSLIIARKKDSDSEQTYAAIVAGAREVLRRDGPKAVSFRRVATACGLSAGTISYYFPDRVALLEACLDPHSRRRQALMAQLLEQVRAEGPSPAVIATIVDAGLDLAFSEQTMVRLRALTNAEIRALRPDHPHDVSLPHLDQLGAAIGEHLGLAAVEVRLVMQTLNYAIGRYAELSESELCRVTGTANPAEARQLVAHHIHRCAAVLLGPQRGGEDASEES